MESLWERALSQAGCAPDELFAAVGLGAVQVFSELNERFVRYFGLAARLGGLLGELSDLCMVRGGAVQAGIFSGVYHDLLLSMQRCDNRSCRRS